MKSLHLKQLTMMAVLATCTGLASACPDVPHSAYFNLPNDVSAPTLGFDAASTADPSYLPSEMGESSFAMKAEKDLDFDLASTADPSYMPPEFRGRSVLAGLGDEGLSGSSDLNLTMDPTAAGNSTPYCDWEF